MICDVLHYLYCNNGKVPEVLSAPGRCLMPEKDTGRTL